MKRRSFLKAAAAAAIVPQILPRHVLGGAGQTPPSEKLCIAGIGVGGQGGGLLRDPEIAQRVHIAAVCDVDWALCAGNFKRWPQAELFKDFRVLLDKRKDLDAVIIATPDHMHAPIAIAALRAGKHVYVEKPMAHTVRKPAP
jgi:predicted dehydrogenase